MSVNLSFTVHFCSFLSLYVCVCFHVLPFGVINDDDDDDDDDDDG